MKRRKTRKIRIGSSRIFLASVSLVLCFFELPAADKPKKPSPYSVVAGTVFKESGLSLPGASVTLSQETFVGAKGKAKSLSAVSDSRGEFAFRVPPVTAKYAVSAMMKGYSAETKIVAVSAEERIDVTFTLREESK